MECSWLGFNIGVNIIWHKNVRNILNIISSVVFYYHNFNIAYKTLISLRKRSVYFIIEYNGIYNVCFVEC